MKCLGHKKVLQVLIALFFVSLTIIPGHFQAEELSEKHSDSQLAIMIVLDRINIEDLTERYPHLQKLMNQGAIGLMNIRTAGRYDPASGYLTLGSGVRANVPAGVGKIFDYAEKVEGEDAYLYYENLMGLKPPSDSILVVDMPSIILENEKQNHEIIPGLLGETLNKAGITVNILGNADTSKANNRLAALIGMDTLGIIPRGKISEQFTSEDASSPFLIKTDYSRLLEKVKEYKGLDSNNLVIIHLGDTIRADNYQDLVLPKRAELFRKRALVAVDSFMGQLLEEINLEKDLLLVVTPFPSSIGYKQKNLLTPFIMAGPKIEGGLAFAPTTRRPGIITNIDVAPTLLDFFKISRPDVMLGYPITARGNKNNFSTLYEMNQQIKNTFVQRSNLIMFFIAFQIIVSFSFLVLFFFKKRWLKAIKPFILASLTVPLAFLVLSLFKANSILGKYLWLLLLMFILTFSMNILFKDVLGRVAFISLITAGLILLDLTRGSPLMQVSILGYDPIGGSRYYGLGNEYMGVLISSLIIGLMALWDKYSLGRTGIIIISTGVFLITFYLIMSPKYGSNVGGTISALGAFTITMLLILDIKVGWKHFFLTCAGVVLALAILFFIISPLGPPSHISKTVELIQSRGWQILGLIFSRKLAMNYKLLKYTVWTKALLALIIVLIVLLYKPPYLLKSIFKKYKYLYHGFIGTGVGCILALIFNDSGVVAAATMMIFIALPVFLLVIDENH